MRLPTPRATGTAEPFDMTRKLYVDIPSVDSTDVIILSYTLTNSI